MHGTELSELFDNLRRHAFSPLAVRGVRMERRAVFGREQLAATGAINPNLTVTRGTLRSIAGRSADALELPYGRRLNFDLDMPEYETMELFDRLCLTSMDAIRRNLLDANS